MPRDLSKEVVLTCRYTAGSAPHPSHPPSAACLLALHTVPYAHRSDAHACAAL